jgi:hypothetical protein
VRISGLGDLAINLSAALIGFAVAWLRSYWRHRIRDRHARRFWKPFTADEAYIVLGGHAGLSEPEFSGWLGVGDVQALMHLDRHIRAMHIGSFTVAYSNRMEGGRLDHNLVLLGGPDGNVITKEVVEKLHLTIRPGDPALHIVTLYDDARGKEYTPSRRADGELVNDYGVVVRAPNPLHPRSHVLLIAGSYGSGTWAGARLITDPEFLRKPLVAAGLPFECIFDVDVVRGAPHRPRILDIRQLDVSS